MSCGRCPVGDILWVIVTLDNHILFCFKKCTPGFLKMNTENLNLAQVQRNSLNCCCVTSSVGHRTSTQLANNLALPTYIIHTHIHTQYLFRTCRWCSTCMWRLGERCKSLPMASSKFYVVLSFDLFFFAAHNQFFSSLDGKVDYISHGETLSLCFPIYGGEGHVG